MVKVFYRKCFACLASHRITHYVSKKYPKQWYFSKCQKCGRDLNYVAARVLEFIRVRDKHTSPYEKF